MVFRIDILRVSFVLLFVAHRDVVVDSEGEIESPSQGPSEYPSSVPSAGPTIHICPVGQLFNVEEMECECPSGDAFIVDEFLACPLPCDPGLGQVFKPSKLKCVNKCKAKKGLTFDFIDQDCVSVCGTARVWNKRERECECPGDNEKYKTRKDKCRCKSGFVRNSDDNCVLPD